MTVKEIAYNYISSLRNTYKPLTKEEYSDINENNYKALQDRFVTLKQQLDSIMIRKDYSEVDAIYKSVYSEELNRMREPILEESQKIDREAKEKYDLLNEPIRQKYKDVLAHFEFLKSIHVKLSKYKDLLLAYKRIFNVELVAIEDLDINRIVEKTGTIDSLISKLNIVEGIKNTPVALANTIVILFIGLLFFNITGILIVFILLLCMCIFAVLLAQMKNNNDIISFTLQDIEEPNRELYKGIDWDSEEFHEFELRMMAIKDKLNSPEILELKEKSQGKGVELYREEYDKYIQEYRDEYNNQVEMLGELENKLNEFIGKRRDTIVPLGKRFSWSYKLDYNFSFGLKDGEIDETKVNIKDKVIVLVVGDKIVKEKILLLLALNMMSNVRYTNVNFIYYDRINRGDALVSYKAVTDILKIYTNMTDCTKDIDDLMTSTTRKVKKITRNIDEYNEGADNEVNLPTPYTMAIFEISDLGDGKTELGDKAFTDKIPGMLSSGIIPVLVIQSKNLYTLPYDNILIGSM